MKLTTKHFKPFDSFEIYDIFQIVDLIFALTNLDIAFDIWADISKGMPYVYRIIYSILNCF